jgi:hypothetical protein
MPRVDFHNVIPCGDGVGAGADCRTHRDAGVDDGGFLLCCGSCALVLLRAAVSQQTTSESISR